MRMMSLLFTLLLIIIGATFAVFNAKFVPLNYLIGSKELPVAFIFLIGFTTGALLTLLIMGFNLFKLKTQNKRLANQLKQLLPHE